MRILNISTGTEICDNTVLVKSFLGKLRGLMFSRPKNLVFDFFNEKKIELHMFFVFSPIDLVFLDSYKKVVFIKKNFKPFSFFNCPVKARYVIEFGNFGVEKIKLNDLLSFQ